MNIGLERFPGRSVRAAENLWAPPPPIFEGRSATAADNLLARRRGPAGLFDCCVAFFTLGFSIQSWVLGFFPEVLGFFLGFFLKHLGFFLGFHILPKNTLFKCFLA